MIQTTMKMTLIISESGYKFSTKIEEPVEGEGILEGTSPSFTGKAPPPPPGAKLTCK